MAAFQKVRVLERDLVFGKKEVAVKLSNTNSSNASTMAKEKNFSTLPDSGEKEKTTKIVKIGIINLFISLYDQSLC